MNLLALLLGLFLEHRLTRLFSLRELRWFDPWFDAALKGMSSRHGWLALLIALPAVLLPVLPVAWVCFWLSRQFFGVPYVALSIVLLLVSLGPRNLGEDVEDLVAALRGGDEEEGERLIKALTEHAPPDDSAARARAVSEAVFVQANNRLFGVIFWFVLLGPFGPAGAWLFRLSDLLRRRAAFEADRTLNAGAGAPAYLAAVNGLHGVLAWAPARLLALGYALAGSFDQAFADWRGFYASCSVRFFEANEAVLACVGCGALGEMPPTPPGGEALAGATQRAHALVNRTLWIWLTGIALMTIFGSIR